MPPKAVYAKLPRATSVRLWRLNWLAAALHLISAVILFVLTDTDATTPVYAIHANTHRGNHTLYGPTLRLLGEMPVGYLAGVFLLLAAVDHAAVASSPAPFAFRRVGTCRRSSAKPRPRSTPPSPSSPAPSVPRPTVFSNA